MQNYQILGRQGEGTFSEVLRAQDKTTNQLVAIKCIKKRFKSMDQVNKLREVLSIRRLQSHHNIVKLISVLFDRSSGRLALVFELMDLNLYELIKDRKQYLPDEKVCWLTYQMLKGLEYIHSHGLLHRDIKPENLLINVKDNSLKIADFGSSRGIYCNQPFTEYISTRWYRAPECVLTDGYYTYKMDLWSAGCVFFEIMTLFPLFPGSNELDQIHRIHNVLGTPPADVLERLQKHGSHIDFVFEPKKGTGLQKLVPSASPEGFDLLTKLLEYDEDKRVTAKEALRHPYFKKLREAERRAHGVPHKRRVGSLPLPQEGGDSRIAQEEGPHASSPTSVTAKGPTSSGWRSGGQRRLSDHGTELPPLVDVPSPTKHSYANGTNSLSSSLRRIEVDGTVGDIGLKANSFARERKTRRMSLPKL